MATQFSIPLSTQSTSTADANAWNNGYQTPVASTSVPATHVAPSQVSAAWTPPSHWNITASSPIGRKRPVKFKDRTKEENETQARIAAKVNEKLAADRAAVLKPDVDTPFENMEDVISRLLPYHILQQPQEDLDQMIGKWKGKRKATELETEIAETKLALELHKRRHALEKRFMKVRLREGRREAPIGMTIALNQLLVESDRNDQQQLQAEHRAAKQELDRLEREKRAAAQAARMAYVPQVAAVPMTNPNQASYYRGFPYSWPQPYAANGVPASSMTTFSVSSPTPISTTMSASQTQPHSAVPMTSTTSGSSGTASPAPTATPGPQPSPATSTTSTATAVPIPVQLPIASLPALQALSMIPSPVIEGRPPPAVALRGLSNNGMMVNLEITVSLLTPQQLSGLAVLLNSLVHSPANKAQAA